jgi:hypothetical protein
MTPHDQKLADAIIAMVQLSPGDRATVMSVVERMKFTTAEASEPVGDKPKRPGRKAYDCDARKIFFDHAKQWGNYGEATRGELIRRLAANYSRSEAAIQRQIDYYRTGK